MSYNGSGTFSINTAGQPVVTGTVISSTAFNALTADLATGLSTAITKDGQTTTTSRILFAQGISSTLVTDATSSTTGSIISAGGISCQKQAVVGTLLGVGMAPVNVLDITQSANANSVAMLLNNTAGTAAMANFYAKNSIGSVIRMGMHSGSFTSSGVDIADAGILYADGAGGLAIGTNTQPIRFYVGSTTEVARFDSSGRLGIGMTPSNVLDVAQSVNTLATLSIKNVNAGTSAGARIQATNGTYTALFDMEGTGYASSGVFRQNGCLIYADGPGGITIDTGVAQPIYFGINNTEVARIDSSGNLLVGKTTVGSLGNGAYLSASGVVGSTLVGSTSATDTLDVYSSGASAFRFYVDMGGTIHATGTSITAISDRTLKTNIRPLDTGLKEIMGLQPRRFDWINGDGENIAGFVAQEVEEVLPELVTSSKYSVDENGDNITKKAVKMGDMIPHLVAAIQELTTRLAALENK